MKRFVLLLLIVAAAWYGWQHYGDLFDKQPRHEAVIENTSGRGMVRVRLSVDGRTFVKESIPDEGEAVFPFQVGQDATFGLVWQWADAIGEHSWSGGMVPRGPMTQRHFLTVDGDGSVLYRAVNK